MAAVQGNDLVDIARPCAHARARGSPRQLCRA